METYFFISYFGLIQIIGFSLASLFEYAPFYCKYNECCDKPWINLNLTGLKEDLNQQLYGQHLAKTAILSSLSGFIKNDTPKKALAMSFNGLTGSGKSFVSKLIAKHLYKQGMLSKYVHMYIANKDFPHLQKVPQYQDKLREDIPRFTKDCGRSLFIFEEVEKMPPGTIDVLRPYLDYHDCIDGTDYRKNIFIFLSNSGSTGITNKALQFWADGKNREEITMKDIEPLVSKGSFNEKGGFQYSELLSSELIDVFAPFLPLEKTHVRSCIKTELSKMNKLVSSDFINLVADSLNYFPEETELYAISGCKRIENKVHLQFES